MVWRREDPQGNESSKIRWEIVRYTRGRGLDVGCGPAKQFPHFIGIDNGKDTELFGMPIVPDVRVETAEKLSIFASGSMDFVFSSHLLEHIPYEHVPATLKEWMRVIRMGGYLVLYLPDENEYPKIGEDGANIDHKWNVNKDRVLDAMPDGFDLVDFQVRNEDREYSLFFVFQKFGSGRRQSWSQRKRPEKTVGVVRYGAFGDLLQTSSVIAGLKRQGYHVTLYTSPPGVDAIRHDPNIDEFYLQDRDQVPNHYLGDFWAYHKKKYDKWVQLSESVEGAFLSMPGRTMHEWAPAVRHRLMNHNYVQVAHELAGVPHEPRVKFYPTEDEKRWAQKERGKCGEFVITWSLAGSSVHKTWPYLDNILAALLLEFPFATITLVGGPDSKILEAGWENEARVRRRCGEWSIRQSLAFAQVSDLVIGPETGVLNAVSHEPMPKVVFLSHSTHENLTRDWVNVHPLASESTSCPGRGNNEAPACHQLHYGWSHCKRHESGTAQCQADISAEDAWKVIWHVITWAREKAA